MEGKRMQEGASLLCTRVRNPQIPSRKFRNMGKWGEMGEMGEY